MTLAVRLLIAVSVSLFIPTLSAAQSGAVSGFGGVSINGSGSRMPDLGGNLAFELTLGVELIGEAGRVGNVLPPVADALFSATSTGLRASAFYGEGGVRFRLAPHSHVSPYAEATAGVARLDVTSTRFGPLAGTLTSAGIALLGRTGPVAGAGGGILFEAGPVVFDVGYRYKQFFPPQLLEAALGLGQTLRSHQVRAGFGVRF